MGNVQLILSGGGLKGAYEIGVWKALEEMRADIRIDQIIGTSVGALNAVLLDYGGYQFGKFVWENLIQEDITNYDLKKFLQLYFCIMGLDVAEELIPIIFSSLFFKIKPRFRLGFDFDDLYRSKNIKYHNKYGFVGNNIFNPNLKNILNGIIFNGLPFNQDNLKKIIEDNTNLYELNRDIYIVCTKLGTINIKTSYSEIFHLNDEDYDNRLLIILASSALPIIYKGLLQGINIHGNSYVDGGITEVSNTPIKYARKNLKWNKTITVWLNHRAKPKDEYLNNIDIIPSESLGYRIKVDIDTIKYNINLGYEDTKAKKDEILSLCK